MGKLYAKGGLFHQKQRHRSGHRGSGFTAERTQPGYHIRAYNFRDHLRNFDWAKPAMSSLRRTSAIATRQAVHHHAADRRAEKKQRTQRRKGRWNRRVRNNNRKRFNEIGAAGLFDHF